MYAANHQFLWRFNKKHDSVAGSLTVGGEAAVHPNCAAHFFFISLSRKIDTSLKLNRTITEYWKQICHARADLITYSVALRFIFVLGKFFSSNDG